MGEGCITFEAVNVSFTIIYRFQWIRAMYCVPQIAQCITAERAVSDTIHLNESHVFFLENTPVNTLYDFFFSKQLIVHVIREIAIYFCLSFYLQLIGIRRSKKKLLKHSTLFGTESSDTKLCERLQPVERLKSNMINGKVVADKLAVASFDISLLLKYSWCFTAENQFRNPASAMNMKRSDPLSFTDMINPQELNLDNINVLII